MAITGPGVSVQAKEAQKQREAEIREVEKQYEEMDGEYVMVRDVEN